METNQEGKSEKTFKNFGKRVDEFLAELNEAGEKLQKEFQEKYEELKVSAEKLKKDAENKERWKEVENSLKKAGDEFSKAFKAAFSKRPEDKE
jgi:DNA-binding ferritin-like protein (Dps family)